MKNPIAHILTVPALFLAVSSARADVTVPLKNFEAGRFEFAEIFRPGDLTGTLTGVSAFVSLNDTRTFTFAQDLAVYVVAGDLGQGVAPPSAPRSRARSTRSGPAGSPRSRTG